MFSWTEKALDTPNTQLALYVVYELQWISVPTSPWSLWHAGSNASTGRWAVWIIYPCWKNYSAELATACNERHKEWASGISVRVLTGRSLGHGSMLYSQVLHWIMYPYVLSVCTELKNQLIDLLNIIHSPLLLDSVSVLLSWDQLIELVPVSGESGQSPVSKTLFLNKK
jgi:hypothetical protein